MFNEMLLRPNLQHNTKNDVVIGYSDNGLDKTAGVPNTAFVALLSGLSTSWIQPLALAVAKTKLRAEATERLLLALIEKLREVQLLVKAVVCDQGSSDVQLFEMLNKCDPTKSFL